MMARQGEAPMSLANLLNGFMRDALSPQTMDRMKAGAQNAGAGVESTLENFMGRERVQQAKDYFSQEQAGGLTGAQIGGAGALLGAVFGGGLKGAAKGGALAVLGSLAYKAYQSYEQGETDLAAETPPPSPRQIETMTAPDTEKLVLRAMIAAARADGRIDGAEMDRIVSRMSADGVTPEDKAFVDDELSKPVDPEAIAAEVSTPEVATEIYLASLLAIDVDHQAEFAYLRRLAAALGLEAGVVARLHRMTGAPLPA
jgi:uncharacterized membrane protein YebE (DUF533 family)